MKTSTLIIIFSALVMANTTAQTKNDSAAIIKTSLNYLEGWYTGNVERMDAALHSDLVKRKIHLLKQTGKNILNQSSKTDMIEYTRAGFGKQDASEGMDNDILILDIYEGIACVR